MDKIWSDDAWEGYLYWQTQDKKTLKKINNLIKDIERNGEKNGIGHPEPLKENLSGEWSRTIDDKNRLVYHNEVHNRMLGCFFPKGCDFSCVCDTDVEQALLWMNAYPRKILKGETPQSIYTKNVGL